MHTLDNVGPIRKIILQSTPYCNIRCRYCYLTEESRSNRARMLVDTATDIVKYVISSGYADSVLNIEWHAGEPLTASMAFYEEAYDKIKLVVGEKYNLRYEVQTNGICINDKWCSLFKKQNWNVGVSIDGPDFIHNLHRKSINNKDTHYLVMRGINYLRKNEISFSVLSVLTADSLDYPKEIFDFFVSIGAKSVGFNAEQLEGNNIDSTASNEEFMNKYNLFFKTIYELQKKSNLSIREISDVSKIIAHSEEKIKNQCNLPFYYMTFDHEGNFSTFSPEMLGMKSEEYGSFLFGNIYKDTFNDVINSNKFKKVYNEIQKGIQTCEEKCKYFFLCGGGDPVNKLCENGAFNSSETFHCRSRFQVPINVYLNDALTNLV